MRTANSTFVQIRGTTTSSRKLAKFAASVSADTHKAAPQRGEPGGRQNEKRAVTERAAVLAHGNAKRTDLVTACRIEQARQDREHGSGEIGRASCRERV